MSRYLYPTGTDQPTSPFDDTPLYFNAYAVKLHPSWGEQIVRSEYPLYGWIPSLYLGQHVGWRVNGQDLPRTAFTEHYFVGSWTGACPVGLTPITL